MIKVTFKFSLFVLCFIHTSFALSFTQLKTNLQISEIGTENNNGIVELYNASAEDINLATANIRLEIDKDTTATINPDIFCLFTDSTPNEEGIVKNDLIIRAHSYFLIVGEGAVSRTNKADFIVTNTTGLRGYLDTNDTLYLGVDAISGPTDSDILQFVGMGENNPIFSGAAPAPTLPDFSNGGSIERKAFFSSTVVSMSLGGNDYDQGNGFNSTDNASDFVVRDFMYLADWQNQSSTSEIPTRQESPPFIHLLENLVTPTTLGRRTVSKAILSFLSSRTQHSGGNTSNLKSILIELRFEENIQNSLIEEVRLKNNLEESVSLRLFSNQTLNYYYGVSDASLNYSLLNTAHQVLVNLGTISITNKLIAVLNPGFVVDQRDRFFYGSEISSKTPLHILKRILFSEIKTQGQTSKEEYIEFYNPNMNDFSLSGWQLYYQSSSGNWSRRYTFPNINISAQSYLLLSGIDYQGESTNTLADLVTDLSLSGDANGFGISLRNQSNVTVDQLLIREGNNANSLASAWGSSFPMNPNNRQVVERKAIVGSTANDMLTTHFYYGNAYHSDENQNDYVLIDVPNPQNRFANSEPNTNVIFSSLQGLSNTYGGTVNLEGENFWNYEANSSLVYLNGTTIPDRNIVSWNDTNIVFTLPQSVVFPIELKIKKRTHLPLVVVEKNYSQSLQLFPFELDSFSPLNPDKGHFITLRGNHFGFLPSLDFTFNGIPISTNDFLKYENDEIQLLLSTNLNAYQEGNNTLLLQDTKSGQMINQTLTFTANSPPLVRTQYIAIDKNNIIGLGDEFNIFYQYIDIEGDPINMQSLPKVTFWQTNDSQNKNTLRRNFFLERNNIKNNIFGSSNVYSKTISTDDFYGWRENLPIYYHVLNSDQVQPSVISSNYFLPKALFIDGIPPRQTSYFTIKKTTVDTATCQWQSILKNKDKSLDSDFYQIELFDNQDTFLARKKIDDLNVGEITFSDLQADTYYKFYFSIIDLRGNQSKPLMATAKTQNYFNGKLFIEKKVKNDMIILYNLQRGTRLEVYDRGGQLRKKIVIDQNKEKYFLKIASQDHLKKGIFYLKSILPNGNHKLFWLVY